jgi:tetratricopeptide (TPR) repeat protein
MSRKFVFILLLFTIAVSSSFSLDFSLQPKGFVFIPLGAESTSRYTTGGGGNLGLDIDFASLWPNALGIGYTAGIEGGLMMAPVAGGAADTLSFYSFGGGLGLYYFPLSRLFTRLDGGLGVFASSNGAGRSPAAFWWRMGGEAGFRFTPTFTLAADFGYKQYTGNSGVGGVYAGLTLRITFETTTSDNGVDLAVLQETPVFPLYLSLYQENPAATLRLRNLESAEIRNVRLSFRAGDYTSSEFNCGTVPLIAKGRTAELPLYADFGTALLNLTENGRILGEVVIRYSMLGKEKILVRSAAVDVYNRNVFPAGDWAGLAAFVSPAAPEVLEFSKYVTGLARTKRRTALNSNLQFAAWLFEGLRAASIRVTGDSSLTEIQYPFQTMAYRNGTVKDVGLLDAGSLEAVGIRASIVPLDGEFITAFSLGINEAAAAGLFNGLDNLLMVNDEVWLPLSMTKFNEGFMESWKGAAERLTVAFSNNDGASNEAVDFIILEDAWIVYPPAPLPAQGLRVNLPEQGALAADGALDAYIQQEIQPKITALQGQIRNTPTATGQQTALYNQLANLLVRAGNMAEAKAAFERAAGMGSVAAMINRGNVALIEKDYAAAERWFTQALAAEPGNATAQRSLNQVQAERNN